MSGKPKIYQGVRVKITVKELLQQRRAKQVASGEGSSHGGGVQFTESFPPPSTAPYVDAEPVTSSPASLQPWQFQSCASCEEIPSYLEQIVDSFLQTEAPLEPSLGTPQGGNMHSSPDSRFQPGPICLSQSLGPASPESSGPPSSFDCSYSPPQLPPFVPLNYSSPSPLDAKSCMYPSPEGSPYQEHPHTLYTHTPPSCYCTSCGSQHLDTFRVPEYFPYANTDCRDFSPSVSMADDFFRRDVSWDACYS